MWCGRNYFSKNGTQKGKEFIEYFVTVFVILFFQQLMLLIMLGGVERPRSQSQSLETPNCVAWRKAVESSDDIFECVWCKGLQHKTYL